MNLFRRATFWKKMIFQKSNIPHHLLFLKSCLFKVATFSKDSTFYSSYLFRRATFLQNTLSEELLFHSNTSYLFVSNYISELTAVYSSKYFFTDCPMKIKVRQAKTICSFLNKHKFLKEGCADLHTPNINKVK